MAFLCNDDLRLRPLEPEDLDTLYKWENNPDLWEQGNTLAPYSRFALREYIANAHQDLYELRQLRLLIERKEDKVVVGIADLFDFEPHDRRAAMGLYIDTPFQHLGIGRAALQLMVDYAFSFLRLHQLYVHIQTDNTPCLTLFRKFGFSSAGILREWAQTPDGFKDVEILQLLNSGKGL